MPEQNLSPSPHTPVSPPSINAVAAQHWHVLKMAKSPWMNEEIGRRMAGRLQWLRHPPQRWLHWQALSGGVECHQWVAAQLPAMEVFVHESTPYRVARVQHYLEDNKGFFKTWMERFWKRSGEAQHRLQSKSPRGRIKTHFNLPLPGAVDMVWANMALHTSSHPQGQIEQWRNLLKVDGFLMFSCLGPDSLLELRRLYEQLGWAPPCQAFTDMHDWGDMLIEAGFSEPVMDVERITLAYTSVAPLLRDLREWGRNLHPRRQDKIQPKAWRKQLEAQFQKVLATPGFEGQFKLSFEVIYGHAVKPPPRIAMTGTSSVSLDDMRTLLHQRKT